MKRLILSLFIVNLMFTQLIFAFDEDSFESEFKVEEKKEIFDPLKGYNEFMTNFNDYFYTNLLFPIAKGYKKVVHKNIRTGLSNFFDNLYFPLNFANNLLQFKIDGAMQELARFSINTTFGLGGFFDPAKRNFNLEPKKEDFGQTLGHLGFGSGFHIVLPILGNSNLRDVIGLAIDGYINPTNYWADRGYNVFDNNTEAYSLSLVETINKSSFEAQNYENLKKDAVELYPFFREIYEQNREKRIAQ